ncbi:hypothetical protein UUU_15150 [Klebsiella pneumoniae subsp. pneumoniae DSM 30104 = JCM 1662 = NBRC 14940]|nr:hypothetical protein UUU_15150 [Klebsiella pneumoniae subsp. pneumoniae DSM 30104 = JCM 1662 = NBRC 14940]
MDSTIIAVELSSLYEPIRMPPVSFTPALRHSETICSMAEELMTTV